MRQRVPPFDMLCWRRSKEILLLVLVLPFLCLQMMLQLHCSWRSRGPSSHLFEHDRRWNQFFATDINNRQATPSRWNDTRNQQATPMPSKAPPLTPLPTWIRNYLQWHRKMREQFPGRQLFEDPRAPKILIRTCFGLCGGLNDRLGQLPLDLFLANQTNRVLLIHWHRPVPLENFLVPNNHSIDWRVPTDMENFFPHPGERVVSANRVKHIRNGITDMFEGFESANPTDAFWKVDFRVAIERARKGSFSERKVLRHRILGHLHEHVLEQWLTELGETDMIHGTATFGNIFRLLFRLTPPLQSALDQIYDSLHLQPGLYSAVHCRVRHPKAFVGMVKGKYDKYPADKTGLPWEGDTRQTAIATGVRAVRCAQTLLEEQQFADPIYFFSDSNDLVRYMSHELYNATYTEQHATNFTWSAVERDALAVAQTARILARPSDEENAHIDKQKGRDAPAYYGTFLDLYLAMQARCVTYGVGFYAVFATKLSQTPCKLLYQEEAWGGDARKRMGAPLCSLQGRHGDGKAMVSM